MLRIYNEQGTLGAPGVHCRNGNKTLFRLFTVIRFGGAAGVASSTR
jgi:hypothetical protein